MIAVIDFGSQYTALIARRLREAGFLAKLFQPTVRYSDLVAAGTSGIILSGGPSSVTMANSLRCDPAILKSELPLLGICYGMQLLMEQHQASITASHASEYGASILTHSNSSPLFKTVPEKSGVWMSHTDSLTTLPDQFIAIGHTEACEFAAVSHRNHPWYGIQFHPEVIHTDHGKTILTNFAESICQCPSDWTADSVIDTTVQNIRDTVGDKRVLCALSGGVDSAVAAVLIHKAIGDRLTCLFIDHGFMRKNEGMQVKSVFDTLDIQVNYHNASDIFLAALGDTTDPEKKRHIIGETFIRVFESEAKKLDQPHTYLAQGTLYSDVIESGAGATIKSHHNVGGLPDRIGFKLLEPLRLLFKDEVRRVGRELGMPAVLIDRQPFPGPGLAIRIINQPITAEKITHLQQADAIVLDVIKQAGLYKTLWQSFAVLTPVKTVGVQGDQRTYRYTLAIRLVTSDDAMTATWAKVPYPVLESISNRICNEVPYINRVVYDITSKPPATIEWE